MTETLERFGQLFNLYEEISGVLAGLERRNMSELPSEMAAVLTNLQVRDSFVSLRFIGQCGDWCVLILVGVCRTARSGPRRCMCTPRAQQRICGCRRICSERSTTFAFCRKFRPAACSIITGARYLLLNAISA